MREPADGRMDLVLGVRLLAPLAGLLLLALGAGTSPAKAASDTVKDAWRQWGGPGGAFQAPAGELADAWPEGGPPVLWNRELGRGYSAILFEAGRLYTMYRSGDEEIVICLDAASGATLWEHKYPETPHEGILPQYGIGPRSTPLLLGERLFSIGIAGRMLALDKDNGSVLWSRDLRGPELASDLRGHGYASSPIAWEGTVIVPIGGETAGLAALDPADGRVLWRSRGFRNSYSSPTVLRVAGEPQILLFTADELVAVDPRTGAFLWSFPHGNQWGHNIHMPTVASGDTIFLSSPDAGSRGVKVTESLETEELWSTRRVQLYHASSVQKGDWVYGSSGTASPAFLVGINVVTGEIAWRERGFAKANLIAADGKIVILDEDGELGLATATPEGLTVHSRARILEGVAWTPPTLVGTTLYARDRQRIVAVDLGSAAPPQP